MINCNKKCVYLLQNILFRKLLQKHLLIMFFCKILSHLFNGCLSNKALDWKLYQCPCATTGCTPCATKLSTVCLEGSYPKQSHTLFFQICRISQPWKSLRTRFTNRCLKPFAVQVISSTTFCKLFWIQFFVAQKYICTPCASYICTQNSNIWFL